MAKDPKIFLEHILESISAVYRYMDGLSEQEFFEDDKTQDSVIRKLEVIGEAVKNLNKEFRVTYPNVPWKKVSGFRDVLIHEYYQVDLKKLWEMTQGDLRELELMVKSIYEKL